MNPAGQRPPHKDIAQEPKPTSYLPLLVVLLPLCFFIGLVYTCTMDWVKRPEIERTLSPVEKAEHDRLLRKHGLYDFSVVLVKDSGLFFTRDGREVRFR